MNALLIFTTAVLVALVLERQQKVHNRHLRIVYVRAGISLKSIHPPVPLFLTILILFNGTLFSIGGAALLINILRNPEEKATMQNSIALLLSLGLASLIAGGRSLIIAGEERARRRAAIRELARQEDRRVPGAWR